MNGHKWIALITLVAFLPVATGCSSTRTMTLAGPLEDADAVRDIAGYTDRDGVRHDWKGQVRFAGADSLEFTKPGGDPFAHGPRPEVTLRLARADVVSLEVLEPDATATAMVVLLVFAAVVSAVLVVAMIKGLSEMDFGTAQ